MATAGHFYISEEGDEFLVVEVGTRDVVGRHHLEAIAVSQRDSLNRRREVKPGRAPILAFILIVAAVVAAFCVVVGVLVLLLLVSGG